MFDVNSEREHMFKAIVPSSGVHRNSTHINYSGDMLQGLINLVNDNLIYYRFLMALIHEGKYWMLENISNSNL